VIFLEAFFLFTIVLEAALIHPTSGKRCSPKFVCKEFSELGRS
jgi:hypothetical protein